MPSALPPTSSMPTGGMTPCWNKAGVWGEGDCPELERFIHCRNCPAYSAAAVSMLDRALPQGYAEAWGAHFAAPKAPLKSDAQSFVIFRVNAEWLALPVNALLEVLERRPVHSLPHMLSAFIKGIVRVRGQLLICVSLTRLLRLAERTAAQKSSSTIFERLLVVRSDRGPLVFPVSEVAGVSRHSPAELRAPPATVARSGVHFTRAVLPGPAKIGQVPRLSPAAPGSSSRIATGTGERAVLPRLDKGTAPEEVTVALLDEDRLFQVINGGLS